MKTNLKTLSLLVSLLLSPMAQADRVLINGAGATFPYPLYSKWFSEYQKVSPDIQINYQSIGSGGGIKQLLDKTVDFGASDAPMTDEELAKASTPVMHVPTVLGAVVLSYNIPGVDKAIQLTSEVIADIFLGKIKKWDDAKIVAINPKIKFPKDAAILVAYRSDGSGTTSIFTDYLTKVSPEWKEKVGAGKSVKWPVGIGGKGNEGVTGVIKQNPGSIGYVELIYAVSNKLQYADVKNADGKFVTASMKTVSAAAAGALKDMPADFRVSITNAGGKDSYPISSFTYLLLYTKMPKKSGMPLITFLNWAIDKGQKHATELHYAPLPSSMVKKVKDKMKTLEVM